MVEVQFLGAAQTVTGSKHLLRTSRATVLLDCGLFQGHRHESAKLNRELSLDGAAPDAVVLSHAHIDHSGALPLLFKNGYRGPIYATPATRDLCAPMLMDAAWLQAADARHIQSLIERGQTDIDPVKPLAEVVVLNGFSAHADQAGLLAFADEVAANGSLRSIALVHGEPDAQAVLAELLRARHADAEICVPRMKEKLVLR